MTSNMDSPDIVAKNVLLARYCKNCKSCVYAPEGNYCISKDNCGDGGNYIWDGPKGLTNYWGQTNHGIVPYTNLDPLGTCRHWSSCGFK